MKLDILAIAAHPDDAELSCSGTLLAAKAQGKKTGIVDLTRGELGTRGTVDDRDSESKVSTEILGLSARVNLNLPDGGIHNTPEQQKIVITAIRQFRPEIILANAINDRHPDHGNAAVLVGESTFLSGLRMIETYDDGGRGQEPWRPRLVLHYIQDRWIKPDVVIDITAHIDDKMKSIQAFKTQFYNPASKDPETYISGKRFLEGIKARAMEMGREMQFAYGEGFTANRNLGAKDIFSIY